MCPPSGRAFLDDEYVKRNAKQLIITTQALTRPIPIWTHLKICLRHCLSTDVPHGVQHRKGGRRSGCQVGLRKTQPQQPIVFNADSTRNGGSPTDVQWYTSRRYDRQSVRNCRQQVQRGLVYPRRDRIQSKVRSESAPALDRADRNVPDEGQGEEEAPFWETHSR